MPDAPAAREVPDLAPILSRLDQIEARVSAPPATPPVPVHARRALADLVIRYGVDRTATGLATRADMTSGNNPGLTDVSRTSQELIDYFDATRYFLSHVASMPFPETGVTHRLPRKTQRTQVGTSAEKVAPPSRDVRTDLVDFTGVWYKGWLDISYELIRTASPDAVMVAVDDMLDEAALDSERRFVAAVETAATPIAAFDFTSWSSFIKGVRAAVRAVRDVAGNAAPKFALTPDTWDEVLAFTDFIGRRILSTVNPGNADGTASLLATELSIAGIMFFESPESTVDVAYNDASLMSSELPPLQLSADNPQLVGRDVAILGNIMAIPRIPAGIVSLSD